MNDDDLTKRIEQLKAERRRLQNLRKISEDGLLSLKQRMAEIEAELLKNHPPDVDAKDDPESS